MTPSYSPSSAAQFDSSGGAASGRWAAPEAKQRMGSRYDVDQRAALFGTFGNGGARNVSSSAATAAGGGQFTSAKAAAMMEAENDEHVEDLEARVGDLKDISLKLREEVLESNRSLGTMGGQFDSVSGALGSTLRRMTALGARGNYRHVWMLMLFVTGLLFVMYLLYRRK